MNKNRYTILKQSSVAIATLLATVAITGCNSAPAPAQQEVKAKTTKQKMVYTCTTQKNEKFEVVIMRKNGMCEVSVDGRDKITVESASTSSPFYSIMHGLAPIEKDGKKYFTIGLSTCTKK